MPLLSTEKVHGWPCKFYDDGLVKVGTKTDRFTIRVLADEGAWFATRLRAELIERELATDERGAANGRGWRGGNGRHASAAAKAAAAVQKTEVTRIRWGRYESTWNHQRRTSIMTPKNTM